jgi:hypothetical protein
MKMYIFSFVILFLFVFALKSDNKFKKVTSVSLQKPMATSDIWLDVNRLSGVFRNNGIWHFDVIANTQGTEWPAGSGKSPIFAAGQWIGAKVNGEIKVAAIQHSATEFQPGEIDSPGVALDPKDQEYRWYELRSDGTGDWNNWPVDQGAPLDENGNPLLIGDQTIFSVWNDLATHSQYGTNPLSIEVRQSAFAFDNLNALGDMQFIKWQLVNKSGEDWDSTYFSLWQDPDLGDAGDDLVGCDTMLGIGFCYNGGNDDQTYGIAPPATGMDFMQGPIVEEPGSTATLPDGTVLQNKKMLQMTCFVYYDGNDSNRGNPTDGEDVWNFMRGFWRDGAPITYGNRGGDPPSALHPPTTYMFPGDPETEQGISWLDYAEDDRRFLMTTGPFSMAAWSAYDLASDLNANGQPDFGEPGVQEIVAAVMVARGSNNLNSVTVLKEVDQLAELAYQQNFKFITPPDPPIVQVSELPNQIILAWDETSEYNDDGTLYDAEDPFLSYYIGDTIYVNNLPVIIDDSTYNFYGYTVYQYSSSSGDNQVVYDQWNIGEGKDPRPYTKTRHLKITENKNREVGTYGTPLINGKEYYFAVVAESFNEFGHPAILSSEPQIITVIPRITPGTSYTSHYGDSLDVTHKSTAKLSEGEVFVWVVDPSKTTGLEYTVNFNADLTWNLVRSDGDTIAKNQTNQSGDEAYNVYDGVLVKVQGSPQGIDIQRPGPYGNLYGFNGWDFQGNRWVSGHDWGGVSFYGGLDNSTNFFGSDIGPADYTDVELRWAGASDRSDSSALGLAAASILEMPERWSKAVVYRRDLGYTVEATLGDIPFAVYDTWSVPERRLKIAFVEDANNGVANLLWDMGWDGTVFPGSEGAHEYFFILTEEYDENYTDYLSGVLDGRINNSEYAIWPNSRFREYLIDPFEMQIFATRPNTPEDIYTFSSPAVAFASNASLKKDMQKIKVTPNPYYGFHSGELSVDNRWVQFTYLPPTCTIRIFTLAGHLVRELEKNDASTPFLKWDLRNEYKSPVGSGVFVYHIEAPGIGEKIGKMVVYSPSE